MDKVCKDIFRAVHEGKWLSIEYHNTNGERTKYWICVKDILPETKRLIVDGLHLAKLTICELNIFVDSILASDIIEGTYYEKNTRLIEDIKYTPEKFQALFTNIPNIKVLSYLCDCYRLDTTPYQADYKLLKKFDADKLIASEYDLTEEQFAQVVQDFQYEATSEKRIPKIKQIVLNMLSIHTKDGLYILAYRKLNLDVKMRCFRPEEEVTIAREFTIDGSKQSIRRYLDADDLELLEDFEKNSEIIKDRITTNGSRHVLVDDMPYLVAVGRDMLVDLNKEYEAINNMYQKDEVTEPIKAFFGEVTKRAIRKKNYPISLFNRKVNMDQLLAIHNGIKYPVNYVQGPPGTGKTYTIVNTILTAFLNGKTVLFTSGNNHPIDGVVSTFQKLKYKGKLIPFPILRVGNIEVEKVTLCELNALRKQVKPLNIYEKTLEKNRNEQISNAARLSDLLQRYELRLLCEERESAIKVLIAKSQNMLRVFTELQGEQLIKVQKEIKDIGEITSEEALGLIEDNQEEFLKYLNFLSAQYIKKLESEQYRGFTEILDMTDMEEQLEEFHRYLGDDKNLKLLQRVFPIMATTCVSSTKLGSPAPHFDIVIMDEASQANTALALIPIIRGENLMLVGDPQQLNPVVLLDPKDNAKLRKNYMVSQEYDYLQNSAYKCFLACDSVNDEVLLRSHYRCDPRIIGFNNKKYYNSKLEIKSKKGDETPLKFVDVQSNTTNCRNTAPAEAEQLVKYIQQNKDKQIGIITPFVNQKNLICELLQANGISNVPCGTVHAFQGDEKDVILFSSAITDNTTAVTYNWLKNNKELINVATSRPKEKLVVFSSSKNLDRLHKEGEVDDMYELIAYVKTNGQSVVTERTANSRALGIKPYSSKTEEAFLQNLTHALENVVNSERKCAIKKEVAISQVFQDNPSYTDLFYTGRFDFVVYERINKQEYPILAIELDGKEHQEDEVVKLRDEKKQRICEEHGFQLIRVENTYARRYTHMKNILINYFKSV